MTKGINDTWEENDAVSAEKNKTIFTDITAIANAGVKDKGVTESFLFYFQGSLKK